MDHLQQRQFAFPYFKKSVKSYSSKWNEILCAIGVFRCRYRNQHFCRKNFWKISSVFCIRLEEPSNLELMVISMNGKFSTTLESMKAVFHYHKKSKPFQKLCLECESILQILGFYQQDHIQIVRILRHLFSPFLTGEEKKTAFLFFLKMISLTRRIIALEIDDCFNWDRWLL